MSAEEPVAAISISLASMNQLTMPMDSFTASEQKRKRARRKIPMTPTTTTPAPPSALAPIIPIPAPTPPPLLISTPVAPSQNRPSERGNEYTAAELQAILSEYQLLTQNRPSNVSKGKVYDETLRRLHQRQICLNRFNAESVRKQVQRTRKEYFLTYQTIQALAHSQSQTKEDDMSSEAAQFKEQVEAIKADFMRFPALFDQCAAIWPNIASMPPVRPTIAPEGTNISDGASALSLLISASKATARIEAAATENEGDTADPETLASLSSVSLLRAAAAAVADRKSEPYSSQDVEPAARVSNNYKRARPKRSELAEDGSLADTIDAAAVLAETAEISAKQAKSRKRKTASVSTPSAVRSATYGNGNPSTFIPPSTVNLVYPTLPPYSMPSKSPIEAACERYVTAVSSDENVVSDTHVAQFLRDIGVGVSDIPDILPKLKENKVTHPFIMGLLSDADIATFGLAMGYRRALSTAISILQRLSVPA